MANKNGSERVSFRAKMVPVAGLEPARISPPHFECGAFANFATPASVTGIQQQITCYGIGGMRWRDAAERMFEKCLFIKRFQDAMAGDEQDFESENAMPIKWHSNGRSVADDAEKDQCYNVIVPHSTMRYGFDGQILSYGGFSMKYCPYCGAPVQSAVASFCSECGQKLQDFPNPEKEERKKGALFTSLLGKKRKQTPADSTERKFEPVIEDSQVPSEDADRNYDGYYEDVLPADLGKKREPVDRSLVVRILVLSAAVFLIISGCVTALYLL